MEDGASGRRVGDSVVISNGEGTSIDGVVTGVLRPYPGDRGLEYKIQPAARDLDPFTFVR